MTGRSESRSGRHAIPEPGTDRSAAPSTAAPRPAGTVTPAIIDPALRDPALRDPAHSDPAHSDPAHSDAVRSHPARRHPARRHPARSHPARSSSAASAPAPRTAAMPAVSLRVPAGRSPVGEPAGEPARPGEHAEGHTQPGRSSGTPRPRLGSRRVPGHAPDRRDADAWAAEWSTGSLLVGRRDDEPAAAAGRMTTALLSRHQMPGDESDRHDGEPGGHAEELHDSGHPVFDETGGLEVIADDDYIDEHDDHHDDLGDGPGGGDGGTGRGRAARGRRRSRPVAAVLSLLVLAAVAAGVVLGGQTLLRTINPAAEDYAGAGTGTVDIRINDGDSLRAIAGTLVNAGVIASSGPFIDAAKAHPQATGIQPGVYRMAQQMSGASALDRLLDPAARQLFRVTVPEGKTVAQTLQRVADSTGIPLPDLQAAAADTAGLGLPSYANGLLEGFLFPATYDVEPGTAAVDVLKPMVARSVEALDTLGVPVEQRLSVITEASIVQAESGSVEDMGKVARVLDNRLADGMPLQLDTTVNYANGKGGVTTTAQDRANPSPYNTYMHPGLPPGAISNPGEEAIKAVLNPTPGDWRFFVVVDPDTGDTRFAVTAAEHQRNVLLFQQWLRDHPNG